MFESLVSGLLQKYLGKYVKNFNTKDLDIALFSGKVVLKNLELRADALDELDLPLRVRSGFLGDLTLDIPFSSLGSQPVVVSIDRIFLVVGTKTDFRPESRTEEDIRAETLLKLEALKQHESDMFSAAKQQSDTESDGFTSRLVSKIIDNLQVVIRKIHVRFEDTSIPGCSCAVGLVIREISAVTTDSKFRGVQYTVGARVVCKRARIQGFGIYVNPLDSSSFADRIDRLDWAFDQSAAASTSSSQWQYIMSPISVALNLRMHRTPRLPPPDPHADEPDADVEVNCSLDYVHFYVNHAQYHALLGCIVGIGNSQRFGRYLSHRPTVSVSGNARQWWHHAVNCVIRERNAHRTRFDFETIVQRNADRNLYIQLYTRALNSPGSKELKDHDKIRLTELESAYSFDDIVLFRKLAAAQVQEQLNGGQVTLRKPKAGFFSRLFSSSQNEVHHDASTALTKEQLAKLYEVIGFDPNAPVDAKASKVALDHKNLQIIVDFPSASLKLATSDDREFFVVSLSSARIDVSQYPSSLHLFTSLASFDALNLIDNTSFIAYQYQNASSFAEGHEENRQLQSAVPLLVADYVSHPMDSAIRADSRVRLSLQPLRITFDRRLLDHLISFFRPPVALDTSWMEDAAVSAAVEIRNATRDRIVGALRDHTVVEFDIDLAAPVVIVPENALDLPSAVNPSSGRRLFINFGRLRITTNSPEQEFQMLSPALQNHLPQSPDHVWSHHYDAFQINLYDMQAYISEGLDEFSDRVFLIQPSTLQTRIFPAVSLSLSGDLPQLLIQAHFSHLRIQLSPSSVAALMRILSTATTPCPSQLVSINNEPQIQPIPADSSVDFDPNSRSKQRLDSLIRRVSAEVRALEATGDSVMNVVRRRVRMIKRLFLVEFVLSELSIEVNRDTDVSTGSDLPALGSAFVCLKFSSLSAWIIRRPYDMSVTVHVGSISVDNMTASLDSPTRSILRASTSQYSESDQSDADGIENSNFAVIRYLQTDRHSPDWSGVFQKVSFDFGRTVVTINPSSLSDIVRFALVDFVPGFAAKSATALWRRSQQREKLALRVPTLGKVQNDDIFEFLVDDPLSVAAANEGIAKQQELLRTLLARKAELSGIDHSQFPRRNSHTQLSASIFFDSLSVVLFAERVALSEFRLDIVMATFIRYSHCFDLTAAIGSACIDYFAPQQQYSIMSTIKADNEARNEEAKSALIDFSFSTYSDLDSNYPGYANSVVARLSGLRFIFFNRFVSELLMFSMDGPLGQLIFDAPWAQNAISAPISPASAAPIPISAAFTKLSVSLVDFELHVPVQSGSAEMFVARLDKFTLANELVSSKTSSRRASTTASRNVAELASLTDGTVVIESFQMPPVSENVAPFEEVAPEAVSDSDDDTFYDAEEYEDEPAIVSKVGSLVSTGDEFFDIEDERLRSLTSSPRRRSAVSTPSKGVSRSGSMVSLTDSTKFFDCEDGSADSQTPKPTSTRPFRYRRTTRRIMFLVESAPFKINLQINQEQAHSVFDLPPFSASCLLETDIFFKVPNANFSSQFPLATSIRTPDLITTSATNFQIQLGIVHGCLSQTAFVSILSTLSGNLAERSLVVEPLFLHGLWSRVERIAAAPVVIAAGRHESVSFSRSTSRTQTPNLSRASSRASSRSNSPSRSFVSAVSEFSTEESASVINDDVASKNSLSRRRVPKHNSSTVIGTFCLDQLVLELRLQNGSSSDSSLVTFSLSKANLDVEVSTGRADQLKSTFSIGDIELFDSSLESVAKVPKHFRQVLAVHPVSGSDNKPFVCHFSKSSRDGISISLQLQHFRLGYAGVIHSMVDFFALPEAPAASSSALTSVDNQPLAPVSRTPIHFHVNMRFGSVFLLITPASHVSRALSISWELDVQYQIDSCSIAQLTVQLNNCAARHARLDSQLLLEPQLESTAENSHTELIIRPFNTRVFMTSISDSTKSNRVRLSTSVGDIRARWTYQDYRLILDAMKHVVSPPVPASKFQSSPPASQLIHDAEKLRQVTEASLKPPQYGDMIADFQCSSVQLLLIDDSFHVEIPIIRLDLDTLQLSFHAFAQSRRLSCKVGSSVDYHNNRVCVWEPMLEHMSCTTLLHQTTDLTEVSLVTSDHIELNVSYAMIEGLSNTISLLTRVEANFLDRVESSGSRNELSDGRPANRLFNETGWRILYSVHSRQNPSISLLTGHSTALELPVSNEVDAVRYISIMFPFNFAPIHHISVDRVGRFARTMRSLTPALPDVDLIFDVNISEGVKHVLIHSTQCVANRTSLPLDVLGTLLHPGQSFWMSPLNMDMSVVEAPIAMSSASINSDRTSSGSIQIRPHMLGTTTSKKSALVAASRTQENQRVRFAENDSEDPVTHSLLARPQSMNDAVSGVEPFSRTPTQSALALHAWSEPFGSEQSKQQSIGNDDVDDVMAEAKLTRLFCEPLRPDSTSATNCTLYFTVRSVVELLNQDELSLRASVITHEVAAPLVFENLLPFDLEIQLKTSNSVPGRESNSTPAALQQWAGLTLPRESFIDCYIFDPLRVCMLSVRPLGYFDCHFDWSTSIQVDQCNFQLTEENSVRTESLVVKLTGEVANSVTVSADSSYSSGVGTRSVSLFAPFWIYNLTTHPLSFSEDTVKEVVGSSASRWLAMGNSSSGVLTDSTRRAQPLKFSGYTAGDTLGFDNFGSTQTGAQENSWHHRSPLIFNFTESNLLGDLAQFARLKQQKLHVRTHNSKWSMPISIDVVGFQNPFTVEQSASSEGQSSDSEPQSRLEFVASVNLAPPRYRSRTKLVRILPRYVLVNQISNVPLQVRQCDTSPAGIYTLAPSPSTNSVDSQPAWDHSTMPFHWPDNKMSRAIRFRLLVPTSTADCDSSALVTLGERFIERQSVWMWSDFFPIQHAGDMVLRIRQRIPEHPGRLVRVEVRPIDGVNYVIFSDADPEFPPIRVENRTVSETVRFAQRGTQPWQVLSPMQDVDYAWNSPLMDLELSVSVIGDSVAERNLKLGAHDSFEGESSNLSKGGSSEHLAVISMSGKNVYIFRELQGPTIVVVISDFPNPETRDRRMRMLLSQRPQILHAQRDALRAECELWNEEARKTKDLFEAERVREKLILEQDPQTLFEKFLAVQVIEARDLESASTGDACNVYASVTLGDQHFITHVVAHSLNPLWNARSFPVHLPSFGSEIPVLRIGLFHRPSRNLRGLVPDEFLGGVLIEFASEFSQRRPVDQWFVLSPLRAVPGVKGDVRIRLQWLDSPAQLVRHIFQEQESQSLAKNSILERVESICQNLGVLNQVAVSLSESALHNDGDAEIDEPIGYEALQADADRIDVQTRRVHSMMLRRSVASKIGAGSSSSAPVAQRQQMSHLRRQQSLPVLAHLSQGVGRSDMIAAAALSDEPESEVVIHVSGIDDTELRKRIADGLVKRVAAVFLFGNEQRIAVIYEHQFFSQPSDLVSTTASASSIVVQVEGDDCHTSASPGLNSFRVHIPTSWLECRRPEAVLTIKVFEESITNSGTSFLGFASLPMWLNNVSTRPLAWQTLLTASSDEDLIWLPLFAVEQEALDASTDAAREIDRLASSAKSDMTDVERAQWRLQVAPYFGRAPFLREGLNHPYSSTRRIGFKLARYEVGSWDQEPSLRVSLALAHFGVSLINRRPRELLYSSTSGLTTVLESSPSQQTVEFAVQHFQIDNQRAQEFPVLFAPRPQSSAEHQLQPFLQFSANRALTLSSSVIIFNYLSLLIQEFDLRVEEPLIWQLLEVINELGLAGKKATSPTPVVVDVDSVLAAPQTMPIRLFFEWLHLQPLACNLSFLAAPSLRRGRKNMTFNPVAVILKVVGAAFGSVERAPLRINSLLLERAFGNVSLFIAALSSHFIAQGVKQAYKLLGSIDILGNPIDAISYLGTGVKDFFYAPAEGLMQSPAAFGRGLVRGSESLLRNSVISLFGAVSKVTGSLGRGFAMLGGEDTDARLDESLAHSAQDVGASFVRGIKGVIVDPLAGARRAGFVGFLKGVATGVVGLAAKPISSLLNFSAVAATYIRNAAAQELTLGRVRPPRFFSPDGVLRTFDLQDAVLCVVYRSLLKNGTIPLLHSPEGRIEQHGNELPILFAEPNSHSLLFVTSHRFILVSRLSDSDQYTVEHGWHISRRVVRNVSCRGRTVRLFVSHADDEPVLLHPLEILLDSEDAAYSLTERLAACMYTLRVERALFGAAGTWVDVSDLLRAQLGDHVAIRRREQVESFFDRARQALHTAAGEHRCMLVVDVMRSGEALTFVFHDGDAIVL